MTEAAIDPVPATLRASIESSWPTAPPRLQERALAAEGKHSIASLVERGDAAFAALATGGSKLDRATEARSYAICFDWTEGAKAFALLWRNILFEWQHALILEAEDGATPAELEQLAVASEQLQLRALTEWYEAFELDLRSLDEDPKRRRDRMFDWSLQQNPWPVYREQLTEIAAQLSLLHGSFAERLQATSELQRLGDELEGTTDQYRTDLATLRQQATAAIDLIDEAEDGSPSRISISKLEVLDPLAKVSGHLEGFTRRFSGSIERLPEEVKLFVEPKDGELPYREINLERQTGQWVSAEILPTLQRVERTVEQSAADLSRTLIDVRNRVTLLRDSERPEGKPGGAAPDEDRERLRHVLGAYLQRLFAVEKAFASDGAEIYEKVRTNLRLSNAANRDLSFLEVSFQAGLSQVRRTQGALLDRIGRWLNDQQLSLRRFQYQFAEEESLSVGEKVVRALNARRTDPANAAYVSVLVTRGFIGESFHAGREGETTRAVNAIEGWRAGFRGTLAITGQRYSGKTHFAELIAGRYFEQRVVRLRPNSNFEIAGRRETTTQDLGAALAFLRKHALQESVMVLIEDLELWWGAECSLSENATVLRETMDDLSNRLFFVVTMGNWTFTELSRGLNLSAAFQLELNLDTMPLADFTQTVLTRHAATHVRLVDPAGKELSERKLREHAEVIWRSARGNVGDGLRRWAQSVKYLDANTVQLTDRSNYPLPNFIDPDVGVVLAAVKRARYPNEYELRRYFGPVFPTVYRPVVQRLIRLGILVRHRSGRLSVSPSASNEIGRILQREDLLQSGYAQAPLTL